MQFQDRAPANLTGVLFKVIKRKLRILANLDQVTALDRACSNAIPAMVVERLSEKDRRLCRPCL